MSVSSNEKINSLSQDEEDSGHDSLYDSHSALDDRERINHLETAVAWIRGEVNELKDYDKDILKDLTKIWQAVHEIRDTQKEVKDEQKSRFLEDSGLSPPTSPHSATPSPEPYIALDGQRYRAGTLRLLSTAPTHLKRENDDKVLKEFFGSEQIGKLNELKVSITAEEETDDLAPPQEQPEVQLRHNGQNKLKIPVNPNAGPVDRNRMSYDVVSEMEQLRARIQEKARLELEDLDKKYSPKLTHLGFNLIGTSSHSRQGSLDSSMPPTAQVEEPPVGPVRHTRQASLPVFFDPEMIKKSPTPHLKSPLEHQVREDDSDSRSPTPPLNYIHVRQASAGSGSSMGSGTFSPPLTVATQPSHVTSHMTAQQIKPYSTPPLIRSPQRHIPQLSNLKDRPTRPQSGKLPSQYREPYVHHAHSHSNPASIHPNPLPSQFSATSSRSGGGYSTTTVKGVKRNSPDGGKYPSNGYTSSKPPLPGNHALQMSREGGDIDQPEVKSVSRTSHLRKAPSGEKVAASPRMGRAPPITGRMPGSSNGHQKLGMRLSEPRNVAKLVANQNGAQVHPEDIQPYMTSTEVKGQVFRYTPYTDNVAKEKSKSLGTSGGEQSRQKSNFLPNEQTWC